MEHNGNNALQRRYEAAVESFVDKVRGDPNVIAVIVYGSVAQGTVWELSDIDMTVVVRDQKLDNTNYGVYEDDLLLNIDIVQRSDLKRNFEKGRTGSTWHSFGTTSKIFYTTDESLYEYLEEYKHVGKHDMERTLFYLAGGVMANMLKIRKFIEVKHDTDYARVFVTYAANNIAQMEVCGHYQTPTREAVLEAAKLNPALMVKFFYKPLSMPMSVKELYALIEEMDKYLMTHYDALTRVADECFGDGEIKTGTQAARFFQASIHELHTTLEFLCDKGYLTRVSQTIRLTPKSRPAVEEMAYIKNAV